MASRIASLVNKRLVLLLAVLVGIAFAALPSLVSAAPSNVQLSTSGFTVWNNRVSVSWTDGSTYDCDGRYDGNYDYPNEPYDLRTYTGGTFVGGARVSSGCTTRSATTSGANLGSGGNVRVGVYIRYDSSGRVRTTPSAYSNYRTVPTRPNITSASVSGTTLTVNWDAPTHTGSDLDWWIIASTSSSVSDQFVIEQVATDWPGARTGSLDLSSHNLTFGEPIHVWVAVSNAAPITGQAHHLYWSTSYEVDTDTLEACTEGDVEDLGYLTGYDHSLQGSFIDAPCEIDGKTSHAYKFRLGSQRDVDATFTPGIDFASGQGVYEVTFHTGALDGTVLKEGNGEETFDITTIQIAPAADYYVTISRSGLVGGDAWTLALSYGFIAPPTPTTAPTPTPRAQLNVDFRLYPDPGGLAYEFGQIYPFTFQGDPARLPVQVRAGNSSALALSASSSFNCSSNASSDDTLSVRSSSTTIYLRTCASNANSTLELLGRGDEQLAVYSVFIAGDVGPTPGPQPIPQGWGHDVSGRDLLGLTIVIASVCRGVGSGCDAPLIKNAIVFIVAVALASIPQLGRRRRESALGLSPRLRGNPQQDNIKYVNVLWRG